MSGSNDGSRRSLLRASTAALHDELEHAMEGRQFFASLSAYLDYLLRLHLFYGRFCEAMRITEGGLLERWSLDRHRDWLAADLVHFGLGPPYALAAGMASPRIACRASAYGATYVVLGSSLGARILARRITPMRDAGSGGFTYIDSLATSGEWPRFVADLETEPSLTPSALLRGARETFASFKDHMLGSPVR